MGRRVRVFLNKTSGGEDAGPERLIALFAEHDCACVVTELSRSIDLEALVRNDPEEVAYIAAGGDGTVNCVANLVAKTRRRMGVLPAGTLNHFAKDLGLPMDLDGAVAVASGSVARSVDAGEVNCRIFVNNSSVGVYPLMVLDRERMKRAGWNRWASLAIASLKSFVRLRRFRVHLQVDGVTRRARTPFLFIGNNEYCLEGSRLGSRPNLNRGELAFYLADDTSRTGILRMVCAALLGRLRKLPEYEELQATEATICVRQRRPRVSCDGEVKRMIAPLHYRILPGALQVLCPPAEGA